MQQLLLRQVLLFSDTFVASIVVLKIVKVIEVERHSYQLSPLSITIIRFSNRLARQRYKNRRIIAPMAATNNA